MTKTLVVKSKISQKFINPSIIILAILILLAIGGIIYFATRTETNPPPQSNKKNCMQSCLQNSDCNNNCPICDPTQKLCRLDMKQCVKAFPSTRADKGGGMSGTIIIKENNTDKVYYVAASYNYLATTTINNFKTLRFGSFIDKNSGQKKMGSRVYITNICANAYKEGTCTSDYHQAGQDPNCGFYQIASNNAFTQFQLLNKRLEFDVDLSMAGCCCDLSLYFVGMPGVYKDSKGNLMLYDGPVGDFYCDANAWSSICGTDPNSGTFPSPPPGGITGGAADYVVCPEMDIIEANKSGIHITPHACNINDNGGYFNQGSAGMYMKGDEFTVDEIGTSGLPKKITVNNKDYANCDKSYGDKLCDTDGRAIGNAGTGVKTIIPGSTYGRGKNLDTTKPFHFAIQFKQSTSNGYDTVELNVILSQNGNQIYSNRSIYENGNNKWGQKMLATLKRGMVMVISYWQDKANTTAWLDGGNPAQCTKFSTQDSCISSCSGDCPYNMQNGCNNINCPIQSDCPADTQCESCGDGASFSNITLTDI